MGNIEWLLKTAGCPIRYNLLRLEAGNQNKELGRELTEFGEVKYWLKYLHEYNKTKNISKIHGSHDYRFENIMGKLFQLGLNIEIDTFKKLTSFYLDFLHRHVERDVDEKLSFSKIYSNYDYELILASFLALTGYHNDRAVKKITQKRLNLYCIDSPKKKDMIYI
jgi:hypothetical protein